MSDRPHSTPQDALEWLRQIAEPDREPNSWAEGEYPLVIQAMMQRARDAHPILLGVVEQLEAAQRERDSLAARLRAQGFNVTEILAFDAEHSPAREPKDEA